MRVAWAALFLFAACTSLVKTFDKDYVKKIESQTNSDHLSLIFSHNISGETHPCGCRHFPLGGLPQVAGALEVIKKKSPMIYVDTGDTFFPSSVIPDSRLISLKYAAKNLAKGLDQLGLDYLTPGDQDFAAGIDFLAEISRDVKFKFLMTNFKGHPDFKSLPYALVKMGEKTLVFFGFVDPETLLPKDQEFFSPPIDSFLQVKQRLLKKGVDITRPDYEIVVLSHSGMTNDQRFARELPSISWIIGAHSQSFTKYPVDIGQTAIAQVLSKNHYLGHIKIPFEKKSKKNSDEQFKLIEIRDELKNNLEPNPFLAFIDAHKSKMGQLQLEEQGQVLHQFEDQMIKTSKTCLECHSPQYEFWNKTAHSLAYVTLVNANHASDPACLKCHTLGYEQENGPQTTFDLFLVDSKRPPKAFFKDYMQAYKAKVTSIESVRELKPEENQHYYQEIVELDKKKNLSHNFSSIQCLNCHQKAGDHPFEPSSSQLSKAQNKEIIKGNCLSCHDSDQSPRWYQNDQLNLIVFNKYYDEQSCPKLK